MSLDPESVSTQLLALLPVGVTIWNLDDPRDDGSLRLLFANTAASRMTRTDLGVLVGRRILQVFPAIAPERVRGYADVCRTRAHRDFGEIVYGDDRVAESTFSIMAIPVLERAAAVVFENQSELRRAEAESRHLSQFLDSIIEHLPAMIFLKDAATLRFERFNRAGEEMLGLPRAALLGKSDYDFFPREQADFFVAKDREVLRTRTLEDIPEEPIDTPRGTRWLHTRKIPICHDGGEPRYLLGVSIDITEQKRAEEVLRASHERLEQSVAERTHELEREIGERQRAEDALAELEEQLRQSQKLEAIGRLAGGVAHDFNNILSVVLGYSDSVLLQLHPADPLREEILEIRHAGVKAADLTRQLLAFSRQQVLRPRVVSLNSVVCGMERMLPRVLGEDIQLHIRTASDLESVKADPGQIEQVLMNLVVNARDAMPAGGKLTIETANVELDESYVSQHLGAQPGPHVMLAVSDSGTGMDRETLARVFEPFFSTKEKGKGTGLGLSTVFGIVKQSGGTIWVYSEPGKGATFKIYFPVTREPGQEEPRPVTTADLRGSETVLLVEDDDQLRALAAAMLQRYGYHVLACGSGAQAMGMAERETVQLLLTDVIMPDMSGRVLAEVLARGNPALRVLFMSGYTDDAIVHHGVLEASVNFLQKPFTPESLARRVRETLHGSENRVSTPA